jgi:hypothetical protein
MLRVGGRALAALDRAGLLGHRHDLEESLDRAVGTGQAGGREGLHRAIDVEHREALEEGHRDPADGLGLGHRERTISP